MNLNEFHDSYLCTLRLFPWNALDYPFMSSYFALYEVPCKFIPPSKNDLNASSDLTNVKMIKTRRLEKSWKKRLISGIQRKRALISPTDDLNISFEILNNKLMKDRS